MLRIFGIVILWASNYDALRKQKEFYKKQTEALESRIEFLKQEGIRLNKELERYKANTIKPKRDAKGRFTKGGT